jgi:hypothetical protein
MEPSQGRRYEGFELPYYCQINRDGLPALCAARALGAEGFTSSILQDTFTLLSRTRYSSFRALPLRLQGNATAVLGGMKGQPWAVLLALAVGATGFLKAPPLGPGARGREGRGPLSPCLARPRSADRLVLEKARELGLDPTATNRSELIGTLLAQVGGCACCAVEGGLWGVIRPQRAGVRPRRREIRHQDNARLRPYTRRP